MSFFDRYKTTMSGPSKRQAQSLLSGDEDNLKRRIIMENVPNFISLDEVSDGEAAECAPDKSLELAAILEGDTQAKPLVDHPAGEARVNKPGL